MSALVTGSGAEPFGRRATRRQRAGGMASSRSRTVFITDNLAQGYFLSTLDFHLCCGSFDRMRSPQPNGLPRRLFNAAWESYRGEIDDLMARMPVGLNAAAIASHYGVTKATVRNWARRTRYELAGRRKPRLALGAPGVDWAAMDWAAENRALAKTAGVPVHVVRRIRAKIAPQTWTSRGRKRRGLRLDPPLGSSQEAVLPADGAQALAAPLVFEPARHDGQPSLSADTALALGSGLEGV